MPRRIPFVLTALVLLTATARAELPSPRLDRITPIGGTAGTSVEVTLVGRDLDDAKELRFDHPGLKAELVKPNQFKIAIAPDVPEGTYDLWAVGRFGISSPRLFAVSRELATLAETEPNNEPMQAQPVAVNSAVNGESDGNGQDCFRIPLKKGERVTIDCQAQKLDSGLDANLILASAAGTILANNGDYHGRDPFLDFLAPADGDYIVTVHDLSYRGGFPYRLVVSNRPHVETVFPRAIEAGKTAELTAAGRNFGASGTPGATILGGLPLDEFKFPVACPADFAANPRFDFLESPTDHSVLPSAATCRLDGFQVRAPIAGGAMHPLCLVAATAPVTLEQEPNDDKTSPQPITVPTFISGRLDKPRDADWFEFTTGPMGGGFAFEVYAERIGGRCDPYIVIVDETGATVEQFDDYGHRRNAFDGHLRDPSGVASLRENKKYRVLVQERYNRGGPRMQYVLAIRQAQPDFHAAAIHRENPGPAGTNLHKGGAEFLDIVIHQDEGFGGFITINAEDLPQGVHCAPTTTRDSLATFVLWSDPDAPETVADIRLVATSKFNDRDYRREVRPYSRVNPEANQNSSRPLRRLPIAVRDTAPYAIEIVPDKIQVEAGKPAELKLAVKRLRPEFQDKVNVIPLAFPGQFQMGNFDIPANAGEKAFTINVQAGTPPGDYTLSVLGQGQVPFNKDPQAKEKPATLVSTPSRPVTITVVAPKK